MTLKADVIVIGMGSTGTGIARDLALRGLTPLLMEKRYLAAGATGACHGLLHSGCRYVLVDPHSSTECYAENRILRRVAASCVEETEGMFVSLPEDGLEYQRKFLSACSQLGIPVEELSPAQALAFEPNLSPEVIGAVRTPDASINPFTLAAENARAAAERGGKIMSYTRVTGLIIEGGKVRGVRALNTRSGEVFEGYADCVINAAGAWSHQVVRDIGLSIPLVYSKGSILIFSRRLTETVLNRCHLPADGDIVVPSETTTLFGTTSINVEEPDHITVEPHEVLALRNHLVKMVPAARAARLIRAYTGVRPLFKEKEAEDGREISRGFMLIDHEAQDGVRGLVSIVGGKMATHRLMAEKTVDAVCKRLGVSAPCTTHLEPLPGSRTHGFVSLRERLRKIDPGRREGTVICECELITRKEVEEFVKETGVPDLDTIRAQTRVGTGPCQGTFCAYRTLGILAEMEKLEGLFPNRALKNFLERRWRGIKPIVEGDQLREEQLTEGIYAGIFNLDQDRDPAEGIGSKSSDKR
jgi:glycerol-3-phosphate dehydrogenase